MLYDRVLIPTDGSTISTLAAQAGIEFAKALNAETVGIYIAAEYALPIYGETIPPDYVTIDEYKATSRKVGETILKPIEDAAHAAGLKFTGIITFSDSPAKQIVEAAEKNDCDLIFMGSHGRGGLGQLLLGSVTTKVLSSCQIPVLVYRSKPAQ